MTSLSEITGLPDRILRNKFKLEPHHKFDADSADNLVFMTPSVLLKDHELQHGGKNEIGAKEMLGLVTKKILEDENANLFKVPEITSTHMGYGQKSRNKEGKRAIERAEADYWMEKLTAVKKLREDAGNEIPSTTDDGHEGVEDERSLLQMIRTETSGLEIEVQGSKLLFFSILLIDYEAKKSSGESKPGNIGPNKISDFLIFWTLPFLLNFSSRKLSEIECHCERHEDSEFDPDRTVEVTTEEVIKNACEYINEGDDYVENLLEVYRVLLGSEAIEKRYKVLASQDGSPIIFVPLKYQDTKLAVDFRYLGLGKRSKRKIGRRTRLTEDFLNSFVKNKEIQRDVFSSMDKVGEFQGIEYGVILPDQETYKIFIEELEAESMDILSRFEVKEYTTRGMIVDVPHCAVVQDSEKKTTVSFSYLPHNPSKETVAALLYALGSQYVDHITVAILHGTVLNNRDPDYMIGNIHPVDKVEQLVKESGSNKLVRASRSKEHKASSRVLKFSNSFPRFSSIKFPQTFSKFEEEVTSIDIVRNAHLKPKYQSVVPLNCLFTKQHYPGKLRNNVLPRIQTSDEPEKFKFRVVNPNGCSIKFLETSLGSQRMSLLIALKYYAGLATEPKRYSAILQHVVKCFTKALVTAGLSEVFPMTRIQQRPLSDGSDSTDEGVEEQLDANENTCSSKEDLQENKEEKTRKTNKKKKRKRANSDRTAQESEDQEESCDEREVDLDSQKQDYQTNKEKNKSKKKRKKKKRKRTYSGQESEVPVEEDDAAKIKQELLSEPDTQLIASEILSSWKKIGRALGVSNSKLREIDSNQPHDIYEKAYQMLDAWKELKGEKATYSALAEVFSQKHILREDLVKRFCIATT